MKKIITVLLLLILIPYLIVTILIKEDEIKYGSISNNQVRVKREKTGKIENIPFEEYVKGVLSGEMPSSFSEEALKAQAVAARSYVLQKIENSKTRDYDVVDTISDQVYLDDETLKKRWGKNYSKNMKKITKAINETKGEYLTYNDKIIKAFSFQQVMEKQKIVKKFSHKNYPI